jgi:hypothetical protein
MSDIHVRRIRKVILQDFSGLIPLSEVESRSPEEAEQNLLTRGQAALALTHIAHISKEEAAAAVVDGFNDNGIDAIYFDETAEILYVVQSKWVSSGTKGPDLGSMQKFISGFKDLLSAKFERFNQKVNQMRNTLEKALDAHDAKFLLLIAYTGTQPLSAHIERELNDLLEEQNNPVDIVSYRAYSQKELYNAMSGGLDGPPISLDVTLYDWGQIADPYRAYYGRVSAEEIASWYHDYNSSLFTRNLRKFKGDTEVNRAIKTTLISQPEKFWYFNNGITVLCNRIGKKPIGGANRDVGQFHFEGVSVVNGAQTVGNIATAVLQGFPKAKQAYALVRFISLENCPPDFATEVTTATNTQNRIEPRDFASLDPTQERLKRDLTLDLNKVYAYKSGENPPAAEDGCTIEEATIALACAHPNIQLAADAKSKLGALWEDIKKPPYTHIFNDRLTSLRLWRSVEVMRIVELVLNHEKTSGGAIRRRITIHGNRFILHRVFQFLPLDRFDSSELKMDQLREQARRETLRAIEETTKIVQERFNDAYLNNFFKSGQKCSEISAYLPKLPEHVSPYLASRDEVLQPPLFDNV